MTTATASFAARTVFRIGYGALQLERLHDRRGEAVALLRRAVELGVDHLDTAEFYGFGFANDVIREDRHARCECQSAGKRPSRDWPGNC